MDKGKFRVDELEHSGAPDRLMLRARSADLTTAMRKRRERSWDQTTLGELLKTIAGEHGLTPRIAADLARITTSHLDQTESDANLLPVLALCQFNREAAKGGRPNMSQLRDSGSIEQDADIVALLYREDKDNFDSLNPGLVEVITAKHRRGEPGIDNLKAKLNQFRMDVWTAEVHQAEPPKRFRQFVG